MRVGDGSKKGLEEPELSRGGEEETGRERHLSARRAHTAATEPAAGARASSTVVPSSYRDREHCPVPHPPHPHPAAGATDPQCSAAGQAESGQGSSGSSFSP